MVIGTLLQAEPDLVSERLLSDRLITVMRSSLALTEKKRLPWSALAALPIVAPSGESSMRMLIERHYVRATNRPFQPVLEAAHWMTVIAMVEAGLVSRSPRRMPYATFRVSACARSTWFSPRLIETSL